MPYTPPPARPRYAVVDLGSNSVRLVVFEGLKRNPGTIFNEKAVLRLGKGMQGSGRLNEEGVTDALKVLVRYHAIARAMGVELFEILATAAVRDASNGPAFVTEIEKRLPGVKVRVLPGEIEAALSAEGLLCGIPGADGILADIGGGSLELVRVKDGATHENASLKLGVIRLGELSGGSPARARDIVQEALASVPWLKKSGGGNLYLVGGAWRALARIHIAQTGYPLHLVHHYTLTREQARNLCEVIGNATWRALDRIPGIPKRRSEDLPFAATVLRRLLRVIDAQRVVFSANGLREGWFMRHLSAATRSQDPMIAAGQEFAAQLGRDPAMPPALLAWTTPLFADENHEQRRLRETACWISDIGSHEHPEYRAEQSYLRVLRQPGICLDHHARAFLGLVLAMRYDAPLDAPWLQTVRMLLDVNDAARADVLGVALRLAYTLSAGTPDLLAETSLAMRDGKLILKLEEGSGVFAGESVTRRLERLAEEMAVEARVEAIRR